MKRFGPEIPTDFKERVRQARFLQYRGFRKRLPACRSAFRRDRYRSRPEVAPEGAPTGAPTGRSFSFILVGYGHISPPPALSRLLRPPAAPHRGQLAAGARQRPDPAVHQRGHGPVQGRVPGAGPPQLQPGGERAALRPRRRQAQRPRERGLHRPPPHLLRDARQLQLRRLLQGRRHPLRLGLHHQRPEDPEGKALGHRLQGRRPGRQHLAERHRRRPGAPHPPGREIQLLVHGRHGPLRPLHRDLLRPRRRHPRRPARARPTRTATATSRSGISSSCSSTAPPTAPSRRCPSPPSTPAWAWSASPP